MNCSHKVELLSVQFSFIVPTPLGWLYTPAVQVLTCKSRASSGCCSMHACHTHEGVVVLCHVQNPSAVYGCGMATDGKSVDEAGGGSRHHRSTLSANNCGARRRGFIALHGGLSAHAEGNNGRPEVDWGPTTGPWIGKASTRWQKCGQVYMLYAGATAARDRMYSCELSRYKCPHAPSGKLPQKDQGSPL